MRTIFTILSVCSFFAIGFAENLNAELITFSSAQDTTAVTDISLNGSLVSAFNGGTTTTTVNGVQFVASSPFGTGGPGFSTGNTAFLGTTTGDAGFDRLLGEASFTFSTSLDVSLRTIDLGAFTTGRTYELQVFFTDQRSNSNDRLMRFSSTDGVLMGGSAVSLESDPNNATSSPFGQFAIGTFVADGNNPDLVIKGLSANSAQINGWQIRDITAVPEPTSFALFGLALIGFARRRK